ncbi:MAG: flagellar motor protein MotD [Gammaproteobacteria bacterium]|jgi:chemotaxis protein MotB
MSRLVRRARTTETVTNRDRWVVSYADFVTLLFAFFVVMYSVSSVNEGKYQVLTQTFKETFSGQGKPFISLPLSERDPIPLIHSTRFLPIPRLDDYNAERDLQYNAERDLRELGEQIEQTFSDWIDLEQLHVETNSLWIEVDIKSKVLFQTGDATPSDASRQVLLALAALLRDRTNPVHVEGFTDDVPIQNEQYPSNWELSTARAAAVVRVLIEGGVGPERLAAVGYGEFQPQSSNETEAGRSQNRRVALIISQDSSVRRTFGARHVDAMENAPTSHR